MEERLQKILSARGVASRRAAEGYLSAGRVMVNGRTARVGDKADPERDEIRVDGRLLAGPARRTPVRREGAENRGGAGDGLRGPGVAGGPAGP